MENRKLLEKMKYEKYSHIRDWRDDIILLAIELHDQYETMSNEEGWKTQDSTNQKQFDELPMENQRVMLRLADYIMNKFAKEQQGV